MEQVRDEELDQLLGDLADGHGYDFTDYSRASLKRRVSRLLLLDKFPDVSALRVQLQRDRRYLQRFIEQITVNVTEMFRDPSFYHQLRTQVIPVLATHPLIRIWHAGCATGEEVYSVAILLREANLLQRSLLYATDLNPGVLEKARQGIFPLSQMRQYSENYIRSGGVQDFSDYYTARYDHVLLDQSLRARMIFSTHNLVSDYSFNEFQLIICRNVLIYFNKQLQDKVLQLFDQSLESLGYLALGSKETLRFSGIAHKFKPLEGREKIWRKML